jgi:hypothetical protein
MSALFVSKDISDKRIKICERCDNYTVLVVRACTLCKCALAAKVTLVNTDCPIGKWNTIEVK